MPKELTHLILADTSKQRFLGKNPNSVLGELLETYGDYFLFGAVMHDVSFFASSTSFGEMLKKKGKAVHGNPPNDTLLPIRYLLDVYGRTGAGETLALMAGALTHMIVDSLFHPFVYYYTGDVISRHYLLETLIDTHLARGTENMFLNRNLYKNLRGNFDFLALHLSGFLGLSGSYIPEIKRAMNMHALTLRFFRSRKAYYLFRLMSCLGSEEIKSKAHLFYPYKMRFKTPFFDSNFFYRHPVTGSVGTGPLGWFVETAVQRSCELFDEIQTRLADKSLELFFSEKQPVSLESGLDPFIIIRPFHHTDLSMPIDRLVSGH